MMRLALFHFAFCVLLVLPVIANVAAAMPFDERAELQPVVLTGDQLPALTGVPVGEIWAYRWEESSGTFIQVPVQLDERIPFDLTHNLDDPIYELTYDWLDADDGLFDSEDEIAFMARDSGNRAPDTDVWVAGADDTRIEIRLEDPLSEAFQWLYLFTSPTIVDEDPSFSYVDYSAPDPLNGIADVETVTYSIGYEGRWRLTRIEVKPGPDLLDRIKVRAYIIVGGETEELFETTSYLLGAHSGKVRAVREVQGACSGPYMTHLDFFYRDTWLRIVHYRVHPVSNVWYYYDYLPPPSPGYGHFYSSTLPLGLPLDGVDEIPDTLVPSWSQVSLPEGTLVFYHRELTPFPVPGPPSECAPDAGATFYWRDDSLFDDLTGDDSAAYGNHGINLYCLDDTNTSPYSNSWNHYFLLPQDPYEPVGSYYAEAEENSLIVSAEAQERDALTDADIFDMNREAEGRLTFYWVDALGEDSYEVYRGELWSPFIYSHDTVLACNLPPQSTSWTTPDDQITGQQVTGQPSYYYLVVPRRGTQHKYGLDGDGVPRPPSNSPCP